jgi:GntR family transcriptional regulator
MHEWHDQQPIYQQLRSAVMHRILTGTLAEGEAVPSVRQVAAEERINPLTVTRAYQMLTDEGLLEKRRGLGLFVVEGARNRALQSERETFLREEWPRIRSRIQALGIDLPSLLTSTET